MLELLGGILDAARRRRMLASFKRNRVMSKRVTSKRHLTDKPIGTDSQSVAIARLSSKVWGEKSICPAHLISQR
jgi:hypothetical protein